MAREQMAGGSSDSPDDVQITILPRRRSAAPRHRIRGNQIAARVAAGLAVAIIVAATGAMVAGGLIGSRHGSGDRWSKLPGAAGVAAAYGYPLRCLSVTIPGADPTFARADFNHGSPCGRYDGYVTAIFHRVDGAWQRVLDANGYACPVPSIPAAVQSALDVCA